MYHLSKLKNGITLITVPVKGTSATTVLCMFPVGSRYEDHKISGVSHFVEHMLFKGTGTRTAEDIAQAIDSIGGQLDAFTAKEYASYYIKVLDEHLPLALDILSDIVLNPAFDPEDVEREKKVIVEEIKMVEDTPDDLVHEILAEFAVENAVGNRQLRPATNDGEFHVLTPQPFVPGRTTTSPPGAPGTAPLMAIRPRSASTLTTSRFCVL